MPIYDFECTKCGHAQEMMRKVSAPSVDVCPKCGEQAFTKQVSAPNFQLNGSGWYATDFKHANKPPSKPEATETTAPAACAPGCACH